jgi:16S rRNA (cytosine1402-N4)-methyltransferase
LEEVMEALAIKPDGAYIDGTFGRGGHSRAILDRLGASGRLLAIDRDPEAVAEARRRYTGVAGFAIEQAPFSRIGELADARGLSGRVDGVLLDLGVSSPQLDSPERGFSFMAEGPLDMRMDPSTGTSASQWLAQAPEREIADVIWGLGEERHSRRIARAIVKARGSTPIATTTQLAELITAAVPGRERHKHPATRTFQAIRIFINRELEELEQALRQIPELLGACGRLAVISFHSLEDRIVKRFIRDESGRGPAPRLPIPRPEPRLRPIGGPIRPSASEVERNPRARSAVLRVAERRA